MLVGRIVPRRDYWRVRIPGNNGDFRNGSAVGHHRMAAVIARRVRLGHPPYLFFFPDLPFSGFTAAALPSSPADTCSES